MRVLVIVIVDCLVACWLLISGLRQQRNSERVLGVSGLLFFCALLLALLTRD